MKKLALTTNGMRIYVIAVILMLSVMAINADHFMDSVESVNATMEARHEQLKRTTGR